MFAKQCMLVQHVLIVIQLTCKRLMACVPSNFLFNGLHYLYVNYAQILYSYIV
ncbi:Os09g0325525 [Oryza sativa Japonica Group]|uniref:Os09g0325525 protein n=1 Tax=Oryza sativa subsp. japonica TaxID=39947 RepID=C7J730_ORYSJ|nr:Os09g0325525 [Oryza sativa Japonica Group]|eukprot:NP_001175775.1 Os09g0325525 [Oryza sativa Japonica Group]